MDESDFSGFKNAAVAEVGFSEGLKSPRHPFDSGRRHQKLVEKFYASGQQTSTV